MFGLITELGNKISESANQIGDLFSGLFSDNSLYREKNFLGSSNKGLFVGKYSLPQTERLDHLLVIGGNNSDNALRFTIPALLKLDKQSVVIVDTQGIYQSTSGYLKSKGYQIKVLNLDNNIQSLTFNPIANSSHPDEFEFLAETLVSYIKEISLEDTLEICRNNNSERIEYIKKVEEKEAFRMERELQATWTIKVKRTTENLIAVLLAALKNYSLKSNKPEDFHLGNIVVILQRLSDAVKKDTIIKFIEANLELSQDLYFWGWFRGIAETNKEYQAVVVKTALLSLDLWSNPKVVYVTTTTNNNLNLEDITKELTALYIVVPQDRVGYFAALINLVLVSCSEQPLRLDNKASVHYFIDNFELVKAFPNFDGARGFAGFVDWVNRLGKRNCYVSLTIKSLEQIENCCLEIYTSNIFLSNFNYHLFLDKLNYDSIIYIEKLFDTTTALISEKVLAAQNDEALLISKSSSSLSQAIPVKLPRFFQNRKLKKLSEIAPYKVPFETQRQKVSYLDSDTITVSNSS